MTEGNGGFESVLESGNTNKWITYDSKQLDSDLQGEAVHREGRTFLIIQREWTNALRIAWTQSKGTEDLIQFLRKSEV